MTKENAIRLFQDQKVRVQWDNEKEKWFFSIVDIIGILTESPNPRKYWSVLKTRLKQEGSELTTKCSQLKMQSTDGKFYMTDVADTQQLLRLIQSIPSPKAEPFKVWLAKVGYERIEETEDPEIAFDRAMETYLKKGYSTNWINQRLKSIEVRKELTDEWDNRGIKKGHEYAILTDEITKAWAGLSTKEYKDFKDLKKENLRDNMTNLELVLNMLAETSTTELSKKHKPKTLIESKIVARKGGTVAGNARKELENKLGDSVISPLNAKELGHRSNNVLSGKEE
ncbi:MAG: Bro-N domain-containing protein [Candidatus Roizmanbacteria bacterium]|nr:Bro-N domain-containing protein [Candidatus Roizmanbacteria bacterium]